MIILGIDPGTLITGYGVVRSESGRIAVVTSGAIKNPSGMLMPLRLKSIFDELTVIIERFKPEEFAVETSFYGKNAQSALKLGQARGAVLVAATSRNLTISEYSPREVKKAIVGNGTASKEQVQAMVKTLLQLRTLPKHLDTTDALAVAICHAHRRAGSNGSGSGFKSWKSFVAAHPEKVRPSSR